MSLADEEADIKAQLHAGAYPPGDTPAMFETRAKARQEAEAQARAAHEYRRTLRDEIAMKAAMVALAAGPVARDRVGAIARDAYAFADKMMEAREQEL